MDVEVDVDIDSCFGCLKGVSKSVQVLTPNTKAPVFQGILEWQKNQGPDIDFK